MKEEEEIKDYPWAVALQEKLDQIILEQEISAESAQEIKKALGFQVPGSVEAPGAAKKTEDEKKHNSKEVNQMVDQKGFIYDKSPTAPEDVPIVREKIYPTGFAGVDVVKWSEVPNHVRLRLAGALQHGRFGKSLSHHIGVLQGLGIDSHSLQSLKELESRVTGIHKNDREVFGKVIEVLDTLKPRKK